ncbi:TIGR02452 family protein [Mogibacterium kristiansenii]|uniref:TIGR02452 family protein n=1 Tax=Mogibacterium kristiansenii TaxID=2606708 RepID=UPI00240973FA|nr:TIGR02452 family protein [Mogibacterium kristiansenii]MDD6700710.1 TIGR02452 family protein [Mogibacterium kristiansenii]
MIAPYVEIIKDANGDLLDDTVVVSVLTCAAPMISHGKEGMSESEYEDMVYNRIMGMLKCVAYLGYRHLVLGAWGCGAFGNDAHVISDLFYKALKEMNYNKLREKDLFRRIDFAVLDRTQDQYNFKEFNRNFAFDNFYRDEDQQEMDEAMKRIREKEINLNKIRGSLAGGAVGDALGYAVEFWGEEQIFGKYGERGITEYELDSFTGKALISDDTQMTLFTANGLLVGDTRGAMRGIQGWPRHYVAQAYQDWLYTQECPFDKQKIQDRRGNYSCRSWLADVPELYSSRAPGNTCLSALSAQKNGKDFVNDYVKEPQNQSKGCGGIMRVAPVALNYKHMEMGTLDMEGAQIAAITHGHSLGYMPAAIVTHIINCIVFGEEKKTLKNIVIEARDKVAEIFREDRHLKELTDIIDLAIELSGNEADDLDNIHRLGEGWVAEETLGIALYCALRHQDDFSAGVISAVNHKGDSDSTGAVTGNILGALLGYDAIEEKWKTNLELIDVIIEMADDLCHGCQMSEFGHYEDPDWIRKYICMQWKDERLDPEKTDKV